MNTPTCTHLPLARSDTYTVRKQETKSTCFLAASIEAFLAELRHSRQRIYAGRVLPVRWRRTSISKKSQTGALARCLSHTKHHQTVPDTSCTNLRTPAGRTVRIGSLEMQQIHSLPPRFRTPALTRHRLPTLLSASTSPWLTMLTTWWQRLHLNRHSYQCWRRGKSYYFLLFLVLQNLSIL